MIRQAAAQQTPPESAPVFVAFFEHIYTVMSRHPHWALGTLAALYVLFHRHHYKRRREHGLSIWASIPGPFGSRITKRLR
jgi:hypothetical protein